MVQGKLCIIVGLCRRIPDRQGLQVSGWNMPIHYARRKVCVSRRSHPKSYAI
jgi:hypothetical protein